MIATKLIRYLALGFLLSSGFLADFARPFFPVGAKTTQRKKQIAVLDFDFIDRDSGIASQTYGGEQNLGRQISDKLIAGLTSLGTCHVIERSQWERVLREQNLGVAGRLDDSTAAKVGRILGVDALIIGKVSALELVDGPKDNRDTSWNPKNLKARITVNMRLVNTTTARVEFIQEFVGISAPPQAPKSTKGEIVGGLISGILSNNNRSNQSVQVKDEQIRDVVYLAVDSVVSNLTANLDKHFTDPAAATEAASAKESPINGRVLSVNGPSVMIADIPRSAVRMGDRFQVRRSVVKRDGVTGKEFRFSEKIGEVEVVEIQDEVIVGSFSGTRQVQEGDLVTNSSMDASTPPQEIGQSQRTSKSIGIPLTAPPPKDEAIERYPVIDCPDAVMEAREFAVQIFLSLERKRMLAAVTERTPAAGGGISLRLPALLDGLPWKVEVVLSAPDFEILDGRNIATVLLNPLKDSTRALFRLKPKPVSQPSATGEISATLWHAGNCLGQISRTVKISRVSQTSKIAPGSTFPSTVEEALVLGREIAQQQSLPAPMPQVKPSAHNKEEARGQDARIAAEAPVAAEPGIIQPRLVFDPNRKSPDLTIRIRERFGKRAAARAEIEIHSPYLQTMTSTFEIGPEVADWLEARYESFAENSPRDIKKEKPGSVPARNSYNDALLQGFGRELYKKLAPPIFRDAFWKLADRLGSGFDTIQIISDNPTIPWELMRPMRLNGTGERGFLGVEFNIGRWHLAEGVTPMEKPPQSLMIESLSVIAPQYRDQTVLQYQENEVQALKQVRGYRSVGGRFPDLQKLFAGAPKGIIHFAGHAGVLPSHSTIKDFALQLEDGPLSVQAWQGLASRRLSAHPFFFFNACHIGQTQRIGNFVNGWAPAVLEAGASGYVGALWPIKDRGAYEFAAKFYEILDAEIERGPVSVASVLRRTRAAFLNNGSPTFLAYVYYGDPNLAFYREQQVVNQIDR